MSTPRRHTVDPSLATDAEVADLVARFEDCTWPYEQWTHRAHLAVAVSYLRQLPFPVALDRVRDRIQIYNRTRGSGEGYHETITVVFMRAIADYLKRVPDLGAARTLAVVVRAFDMAWVKRYYSEERLASAGAKTGWVEPDLRALEC
jgi:hypothetical protein